MGDNERRPPGGLTAYITAPPAIVAAYLVPLLVMVLQPRAAAVVLLLLGAIALIGNVVRRDPVRMWLQAPAWLVAVLAVGVYALVSSLWSPAPGYTANKALLLLLFSVALGIAVQTCQNLEPLSTARWIIVGMLAAVGASTLAVGFEVASNQFIARELLETFPELRGPGNEHLTMVGDEVTAVSVTNINRRITVLTLLFWPALMMAAVMFHRAQEQWLIAAVAVGIALVILASAHQSSQAALVAGAAAFVIARQLPKRVFVLLAGAWVLIFVLVVPLAKVPHAAGWQQASWLFESARQRVIIWNYIASRVPEAFVLGRGADATPHVPRTSPDTWVESTPVVTVDPRQARHPHNVFLQVWYELGAAGAALVMILGLIALHRSLAAAGRSPAAIMRPAIAAMFASMVVLGAFSYSCWQAWYQAAMMIGVLGAANALGYALRGGTPNETSDAHKDRAP